MHKLLPVSLALALAAPFGAMATPASETPSELEALRQEVQAMRAAYETRLQALEQRLKAAEATSVTAPPPPVAAAAPAAPAAVPAPSTLPATTPAIASSGGGANAFNPSMSLILSGLYARSSQDPASYAIGGIPLLARAQSRCSSKSYTSNQW